MHRIILAALLAALPVCARAQLAVTPTPLTVTSQPCGAVIGTTASQLLAANGFRHGFLFQNVSSANIGVSFTSANPAIGAIDTMTLAPGASVSSNATGTPGSAVYAVASAAGANLFCQWN